MSLVLAAGESLQVVMDAAATTTESSVRASYAVQNGNVGSAVATTAGTTQTTLVQATTNAAVSPGLAISGVVVKNLDTVAHTVSLRTLSASAVASPLLSVLLQPGQSLIYESAGGWTLGPLQSAIAPLRVNAQTGTAYTLVVADAPAACGYQGVLTMNNAAANTATIPLATFPIGTTIPVYQLGAGATSIAAAVGVTLRGPTTVAAQYGKLTLCQVAQDTWVAS